MSNEEYVNLESVPGVFAICRLPSGSEVPAWATTGKVNSITRTPEELSIVCEEHLVPDGVLAERDYRGFRISGTLDFSLVGILSPILVALHVAEVSVFVFSTYDTDYLMVRDTDRERTLAALDTSGFTVN
ncbi:ACT domain-containing protein [Streptomyces sp. NBC_00233]|uniref:ACT domain-containing protein n=1 Tax=Streptomyces sp. NBC_00233 TaxID=2975686 RepID=UPI002250DFC3|nr:ACT domain-containing protein [Streptomyces sp. NBC_00233]MCX5233316.1 ACT domain-containing protein [Streptomyces sp. NBC_00233]